MSNYRRWRVEGGTFFFTIVTQSRAPLFLDGENRRWVAEGFYAPDWGRESDWFGDEFKQFE